MPVSLKDQVVLVIGASSGMGRETAVLFAREGAKVMVSARRGDRLEELQQQLSADGHKIAVHAADSTDPAAMEALVAATRAEFGPVDILVYATGTNTKERALTRLNPAVWDNLVSVNLDGAFYATYAVLPEMRERRKGSIFYISSKSATTADVSGAAYQASKRGMIGLASAIRVEERENCIRACVVCPGLADTELMEKRVVKPSAETLAKALKAEDVAELVVSIARLHPRVAIPEVHVFPTEIE